MATDVTGAVIEVLSSDSENLNVTGAVVEVLSCVNTDLNAHGAVIEVLTALDLDSTHIHGAVLEILTALDPVHVTFELGMQGEFLHRRDTLQGSTLRHRRGQM